MKPLLFLLGALLALPMSKFTPIVAVALAGLAMFVVLSKKKAKV